MQLRFTSFVVTNLRRDLHPQVCAHAGRTRKPPHEGGADLYTFRYEVSNWYVGDVGDLCTPRRVCPTAARPKAFGKNLGRRVRSGVQSSLANV